MFILTTNEKGIQYLSFLMTEKKLLTLYSSIIATQKGILRALLKKGFLLP